MEAVTQGAGHRAQALRACNSRRPQGSGIIPAGRRQAHKALPARELSLQALPSLTRGASTPAALRPAALGMAL